MKTKYLIALILVIYSLNTGSSAFAQVLPLPLQTITSDPTPQPTPTPAETISPSPTVSSLTGTPVPTTNPTVSPTSAVTPTPNNTVSPTPNPTAQPTPAISPTDTPVSTPTPTEIPIGGDEIDDKDSEETVIGAIDDGVENVVDDISESNQQVQEVIETVTFEGILPSVEYFKNYSFEDFYKRERLPTNVTGVLLSVSAILFLAGLTAYHFEYINHFIRFGRLRRVTV